MSSYIEDDGYYQVTSPENLPSLSGLHQPTTEEVRLRMAELGRTNLYFFCKVILGYKKLNKRVHGPMCRFSDKAMYKRRMKLMPRTHFKTTIWTIGETLQDIVRDPNIRILVVSNTGRNAELFMEECQQHFELNEVFRWAYREVIPDNFNTTRWNKNELLVKRTLIAREPTVDAIGAFGGIESRHYDKIKADDLVVEKHIYSDVEMDKLIQWSGGLESLLISQHEGTIDWVGSRKKKGDLYEHLMKSYVQGYKPVDIGPYAQAFGELAIFTREVKENGEVIFPEMISEEFLRRLKRTDPQRYHAQYANSPKGTGLNTFQTEWLRNYKWKEGLIQALHNGEIIEEVSPWSLERIIVYDPSVAEKKSSSKQAIHVVAKGSSPNIYVLESVVDHLEPLQAIKLLFEWQERWQCSMVSIEKRGFQGWVRYHLDDIAERDNKPYLPIVEWPPQGDASAQWAKIEHIRGLQPVVRQGYLWLAPEHEALWEEFEFYPNVRWDDGLDALSQCLTYFPYMEDETVVKQKRERELNYLEMVALGLDQPDPSLREPWDEARFLSMFDATGYGIRRG